MNKPTRFNRVPQEKESNKKKEMGNLHRLEYAIENINKMVEDRGIKVLWEKSYLCPCRNPMTLAPNSSCSICHGRGIAYMPPRELKMMIQSQERGVMNMDIGLFDSGTAIGTTGINSDVTFRDRISLPEVQVGQSMLFNIDAERQRQGFRFPYDVHSIDYATTKDRALVEGKDYEVDYHKNIIYPSSMLRGKNLSFNITVTLRYIVQDLLKESRYQYDNKEQHNPEFVHLPKKLLLKREDAWINPIPFTIKEGEEMVEEDVALTEEQVWEDPKREMNQGGGFFQGGMS